MSERYAALGEFFCRVLFAVPGQSNVELATDLTTDAYALEVVDDGCSIVEAAQAYRPAVVAIGTALRDRSGLSAHGVARSLRATATVLQPLLIAIASSNLDADRRASRFAGFDYHLVAPISACDLDCVIRAGLLRSRRAPTSDPVRRASKRAAAPSRELLRDRETIADVGSEFTVTLARPHDSLPGFATSAIT